MKRRGSSLKSGLTDKRMDSSHQGEQLPARLWWVLAGLLVIGSLATVIVPQKRGA